MVLFTSRGRGTAVYALAPALIALTTWLLSAVQASLMRHEGSHYVRPFGIAYVVPVAALAVLGGARAGLLTLALSLLAMGLLLAPHGPASPFHDALNFTELGFLGLVGGLAVAGGASVRRNTELLRDKREAAERQRRRLREVLASVTDGRLRLCDDVSELPPCVTPLGEPVSHFENGLAPQIEEPGRCFASGGFPGDILPNLQLFVS